MNSSLFRRSILAFVSLSFFAIVRPCHATIQYEVTLEHPEQHLFHITMTIPDVSGNLLLQIPAWNALYQIRDFSAHIQQVRAASNAGPLPIEKLDKETWRVKVSNQPTTITVGYTTYWDEIGPFSSQLNSAHAFINPAIILMYVPSRRSEEVQLKMPDVPPDWQVASASLQTLEEAGRTRQFIFSAQNYDALADAPIEVGKFKEFRVPGITPEIRVVVHGENWKQKNIEEDLRRICQYELKLMDGAPFQHYTFIFHIGPGAGGGGMEHANSTAISVFSDDFLPNVAAHEFFHLWNVKRIRPASLEPVDYTKEQYTRALWFAEGVTSAYASYTLVRSGIWSKEQFYQDLSSQITELEERPANHWQSVEESSLDAWLEKYSLYNGPNYSVSYYTKGQVLGVLLDILIRDRTDNGKSLDDVFREMNTEFAKQNRPYRDSLDVRLTVEKIAGGSFEDFFAKYILAPEPLPYDKTFALAGLSLHTIEQKRATLGFEAERDSSGQLTVKSVDADGPAAQAGLRVDDVILAWNGSDPPRRLDRWLRGQKPGDTLKLRVRRDGKEMLVQFRLGEVAATYYQVAEDSHPSEKARQIRDGLLRGITSARTAQQ